MSDRTKPRQALASLLVLLLVVAMPVSAQQSAGEGTQDNDTLSATVEGIKIDIAGYFRLEAQLAEVEPGFRHLLQSRLDENDREIFERMDAFAEDLLEREQRGEPIDEYKEQAVQWLEVMMQRTDAFLARNRQANLALLEAQNRTDPARAAESVVDLDQSIERTLTANRNLYRMIERLEQFGIDVSEERIQLEMRIREAAEMLAIGIHLDANELAKLRVRLTITPDDADLQTLVKVADLRRDSFARNLSSVSELLEDLGVDSSKYRGLVLVVTGDVASQILDTGVMSVLAKQWSATALAWINDNGLGWAIKLIVFILILMAFRALSKLTRRWAERGMTNVQLSVLLKHMLVSTAANLVMIAGIMIALSQLGISLGPLLAGLGVLGFIIGFALQDTLGNFASGMMILMYRPYDVGDVIDAGGVSGKVSDMTLVYTIIKTFDNQVMVVPNSKIWGDVIKNVTSQTLRRVDLVVSISYGDDIEKTEQVLQEIVDAHELTLDDPAPTIKVHTLGDSSVDFIVRPWVKSESYWDVYWDLTREVKLRFDAEGISIPFPQRDVHVFNQA